MEQQLDTAARAAASGWRGQLCAVLTLSCVASLPVSFMGDTNKIYELGFVASPQFIHTACVQVIGLE